MVRVHYPSSSGGEHALSINLRPKEQSTRNPLTPRRVLSALCKSYASKYSSSLKLVPSELCVLNAEDRSPVCHDEDLWSEEDVVVVKLRSICYLGGSITEQKGGWRPLFHASLEKILDRKVSAVDAFCGNAGSTLLAFTARDWVVRSRPDVVMIEVAINDGDSLLEGSADVGRALEGIVRTIRADLPTTSIVFVEMFLRDDLPSSRRSGTKAWVDAPGSSQAASVYSRDVVDLHARIAEAYGAHQINLVSFFQEIGDGDKYFRDDCHHTEAGARLVARHVVERFRMTKSVLPDKPLHFDFWRPRPAELVDPAMIARGNYRDTLHGAVADRCPLTGDPAEWFWLYPGDEVRCDFEGKVLGIITYVGPDTGAVVVSVDDESPAKVDLVDLWCYYWRLSIVKLWTGAVGGRHRASIRVDPALPDRRLYKRPVVDPNYLQNPVYGQTPKLWLRWLVSLD